MRNQYRVQAAKRINQNDVAVLGVLLAHVGAESKITTNKLAAAVGMDKRTIRESVNHLTAIGVPVVGSKKAHDSGYFIADDEDEQRIGVAVYDREIATFKEHRDNLANCDVVNGKYRALNAIWDKLPVEKKMDINLVTGEIWIKKEGTVNAER